MKRNLWLAAHLIGGNKKSEIVRYFQGRLCPKIGLLCDKLCDFFRLINIVLPGFKGEKSLKCCLTDNLNVWPPLVVNHLSWENVLLLKVRIYHLCYLTLSIFLRIMRFEVNCAKSHHRAISDGLWLGLNYQYVGIAG